MVGTHFPEDRDILESALQRMREAFEALRDGGFMIAKTSAPEPGVQPFAIMKHQLMLCRSAVCKRSQG